MRRGSWKSRWDAVRLLAEWDFVLTYVVGKQLVGYLSLWDGKQVFARLAGRTIGIWKRSTALECTQRTRVKPFGLRLEASRMAGMRDRGARRGAAHIGQSEPAISPSRAEAITSSSGVGMAWHSYIGNVHGFVF